MGKNNVLAIMSAKGGTGKTSTTANLAVALSTEFNRKILAVDTNISTASLGIHFGIKYPKVTMYDVLKKNFPIKSAMVSYNDNLDIIPASLDFFDIEKENNFYKFPEKIRTLVNHYDVILSSIVKQYDLILLDSAPGFSFEAVAAMEISDGVLFVTNPDYPSLMATAKAVAYANKLDVPMGGLVLNKVTKKNYELNSSDVEDLVFAKVAAEIPSDKKVPESIAKGTPIVLYKPYSRSSIAYKKLAGLLIGEKYYTNIIEKIRSLV
jgi:septum site-determining protein MinD